MASSLCPLILHSSLRASSFLDYLGNGFKIRVSSSTPQDTVILPTSGTAVLVINLSKVLYECSNSDPLKGSMLDDGPSQSAEPHQKSHEKEKEGDKMEFEDMEKLTKRIRSVMQNHRMCVVLLVGSVFAGSDKGSRVLCQLQRNLLPSPPMILPAHGDAQVAMHIQGLSKACQLEARKLVRGRMEEMISSVVNKDHTIAIGRAMGLNRHQASELMNSFESVANVAAASAADIHQKTTLDAASAASVAAFLAQDKVTP